MSSDSESPADDDRPAKPRRRIIISFREYFYTVLTPQESERDDQYFMHTFCSALRYFHGHEFRAADDVIELTGFLYEIADKFPAAKSLVMERLSEFSEARQNGG